MIWALSATNGNLLKVNSTTAELGIHQNTAEDYISILEDTFLVKRLPPYFKNKANSLRKTKKLYFIDTGFRNYLLRYFSPFSLREDAGTLLETYVFAEIYKTKRKICLARKLRKLAKRKICLARKLRKLVIKKTGRK